MQQPAPAAPHGFRAGQTGSSSSSGGQKLDEVFCRDHPGASMIEDYRAGDMICSECGRVVVERCIDVTCEWRSFTDSGEDKSRVGEAENHLLTGSGLGTVAERSSHLRHTDTFDYNKQTMSKASNSIDRSLTQGFREMSTMADRVNLSQSIVDRGKLLYKQCFETGKFRGKNRTCIAACCLLIACRQEGVPRTFKEICAISNVPKTELGRSFKKIVKALESSVETIRSGDFMARFCGNLGLSNAVRRASEQIAKMAFELECVTGRSPISVAAAAIYMASQASAEKKTKDEISETSGVAEVTIRQSYRLMYSKAKLLFPDNFEFVTPVAELPLN